MSVVVPTWNEERRLGDLLGSLADQLGASDEVVVCDGGSLDGTTALAASMGARVVSVPERGRGQQLARGAQAARGELLWFLHADMRVRPGSVAALCAAFGASHVAACGVRQTIDAPGRVYRWIEATANRRVRRGLVYGDSGLAVRRSAYEAVGGFRPLPIFEDLDLSRRLLEHGPVAFVEEAELVLCARRWQREGAVRRTVKNRLLTWAWRAGVAPHRLVRYYRPEDAAASGAPSQDTP